MSQYERFSLHIQRLIQLSTAEPGLDPDTVSEEILNFLSRKNTSEEEEEELGNFFEERNIKYLVHFTHWKNLKNILKFGLIPRIFLEENVIRIALSPIFTDNRRLDGVREANCLSVSFPNYRMFYSVSNNYQDDWAIILLDLDVIRRHVCGFAIGNLASSGMRSIEGIRGAEQMFFDPSLREQLNLPPHYTTDPQAEVLEYSVIPPAWIKEVHLKSSEHLDEVAEWDNPYNIDIRVDDRFFRPREDYNHWRAG
jgi:hypothetical protein